MDRRRARRDHDELRIRRITSRPLFGALALADLHGRRYDPQHPDALRKFDPAQPRNPHTGEWLDTTPGDGGRRRLYSWAQIIATYGEQIDERDFDDDSFVSVHDRGEMFIGLKMDGGFRIAADFSDGDGARELAAVVRDFAAAADDYDPNAPNAGGTSENGLVDWSITDGVLVGYTPLGEVSLRYVGDSTSDDLDRFDGLDTSPATAMDLADALDDMAEIADEYSQ